MENFDLRQSYTLANAVHLPGYTSIPTTLGRLESHAFYVSMQTPMHALVQALENSPELPGAILRDGDEYCGMLSRRRIFEQLSRPYGVELFAKRPVESFCHLLHYSILHPLLPSTMRVDDAVRYALARASDEHYEPLVTIDEARELRLVDFNTVLMAQSQLLANANNVVNNLLATSQRLSNTLNVNVLLDTVLDDAANFLNYERGAVLFWSNHRYEFMALHGFPPGLDLRDVRHQMLGNDVYDIVRVSKEMLYVEDISLRPDWVHIADLPLAGSWLGVPLVYSGEFLGMLVLVSQARNAYSSEQISLVRMLGEQASSALKNALLYKEVLAFNASLETRIAEHTRALGVAHQEMALLSHAKSEFIALALQGMRKPVHSLDAAERLLEKIMPDCPPEIPLNPVREKIRETSVHFHLVVENLKEIALLDSQEFHLEYGLVDIGRLVREQVARMQKEFRQRTFSIQTVNLDHLPPLPGDARQLEKAFTHILSDFIQHIPDGNRISVRASLLVKPEGRQTHIQLFSNDSSYIAAAALKQSLGITGKPRQQRQPAPEKVKDSLPMTLARGIIAAHGGELDTRISQDEFGRQVYQLFIILPHQEVAGKEEFAM